MNNLKLRGLILSKYPTQADFAQAIGVSETILSRIIKGRRGATPEQKQTISKILGVAQDELFPSN